MHVAPLRPGTQFYVSTVISGDRQLSLPTVISVDGQLIAVDGQLLTVEVKKKRYF